MRPPVIVSLILLLSPAAYGAARCFDPNVFLNPVNMTKGEAIEDMLQIRTHPACFEEFMLLQKRRESFASVVKDFEAFRTDKQAGSTAGTGGTTNLVSKGLGAQIFSVATEYGALTESTSNQTATFKGSLDGIAAALVRGDVLTYCPDNMSNTALGPLGCVHEKTYDVLRRFSYQVSFYTTQNSPTVSGMAGGKQSGSAQPATFSANQKQLAAISAQVILSRSTRKVKADDIDKALTGTAGQALQKAAEQLTPTIGPYVSQFYDENHAPKPEYKQWIQATKAQLEKTNSATEAGAILYSALSSFVNSVLPAVAPNVLAAARAYDSKYRNYVFEEQDFVDKLEQPVLTFEYDENRPLGQPSNSVFRLIYNQGFGKWSLTGNAAGAIYDSQVPTSVPGANRFRDAQAALQVQYNLGSLQSIGAAALSGAYYFQYQNSPAILNVTPGMPLPGITFTGLPSTATQVFAQKGNLQIAQLRLELGAGKTSVRVPISVSYSNRTELIAKPDWRGQIGISYDFDSLFAKAPSGNNASQ
jgi:hypothetical protein